MKCPVCDKGEIEIFSFENPVYNDDFPIQSLDEWSKPSGYKTIYSPVCTECGLTILDKDFPTPEAALEAMRPVVSEEEITMVEDIHIGLTNSLGGMNRNIARAFIKEELEKYYAKD
jgi:hypothetical protein